mgnify:CR=1 FL=1
MNPRNALSMISMNFLSISKSPFLTVSVFAQIQQTIEIAKITKTLIVLAAVPLLLTGCGSDKDDDLILPSTETFAYQSEMPVQIETPAPNQWTDEEIETMVLTLAGECYDDKVQDKRLVCEVILNRVSDGRFGDSVLEVVSAPNQFAGYWEQSRPISDNDYDVASEALNDWYENDCEALSEYLFFVAGDNRENVFRSEY